MKQSNKPRALSLKRRQLDRELKPLARHAPAKPTDGWIAEIRTAIGMTGQQLAERIGITRPSLVELEHAEATGRITVDRLQKAAAALGCHLVYAVVPDKGSLEEMIDERSESLARAIVTRVADTMALEAQGIQAEEQRARIAEIKAELLRSPRTLWNEAL